MRIVSKPSGAKAIGLLSGRFHDARVRLTLVYVSLLAIILFLSSGSIYSAFSNRLEHRFQGFPNWRVENEERFSAPPRPEEVRADLIYSLVLVNTILLILAGVSSYWLAGITLEPIQKSYEGQKRFLSDASHELRTPLSILQLELENEAQTLPLNDERRARIASHLEEVGRMHHLVEDLLALSRLDERSESALLIEPVALSALIHEMIDRLRPLADHHNVVIKTPTIEERLLIHTNKELLVHALQNILKNAIIYNVPNGTVTLDVQQHRDEVRIRVSDTGIGIAPEHLAHIFDRFYRTDVSRSRETGGSGLGLSIVQSMMQRIQGDIEVESILKEGTRITLILPSPKAS
ncbi:hypothetical protein KBA73_05545 [Patescibacteria group bacterium]|nr:hypothetical protein [Patescibacteria group bacterium]